MRLFHLSLSLSHTHTRTRTHPSPSPSHTQNKTEWVYALFCHFMMTCSTLQSSDLQTSLATVFLVIPACTVVVLWPPPTWGSCLLAVGDQVQQLMGIDLLRQQQRWKDGLMDIRHLMANLVQQVDRWFVFFLCLFHSVCFGLIVYLFLFFIVSFFFVPFSFLLCFFFFCSSFFFSVFFFLFSLLFICFFHLLLAFSHFLTREGGGGRRGGGS